MQHSKIVGGSTADRVLNCPGSVALVAKMPPQVETKYMAGGLMLHGCMEDLLAENGDMGDIIAKHKLDDDQADKLQFCLDALDEIDPDQKMTFVQEAQVGFAGVPELDGVFGHADLIGRLGQRVVVLDWKFGDGVAVEAEESSQGLFYAAAAKRTLAWAFDGAAEVEIVIVQPPHIRRWVTSVPRVEEFERQLIAAVKTAKRADAPLTIGDHCRWCTAKPVCPQMTGAVDRAVHTALKDISDEALGQALTLAAKLEDFIADARALAQARLEKGMSVAGWKLVPKRAVRQWADEGKAAAALRAAGLGADVIYKQELLSPAQAEKVTKKAGVPFPTEQVVAVSSGNTIAAESDPRQAVVVIGEQLKTALAKVK
jgi:hypothetical protein